MEQDMKTAEAETRSPDAQPAGGRRSVEKMDSKEIEREIERTREEMGETLDAIQERLSPRQLINRTMAYVRGEMDENACRMGTSATQRSMPIVLVAVGAGLLLASGKETGEERMRAARSRGSRIQNKLSYLWRNRPLTLAAISMAAGAALRTTLSELNR
jgi:hypothetical protein